MENMLEKYLRSLTNITPNEDQIARIEHVRHSYKETMTALFDFIPESRERSIAITELENSAMWAVKAIVLND